MKNKSKGALLAGVVLAGCCFAQSISAADLGGDCCADLEERIAELEATTVRKGNRKVSVTISGWVAEQIVHWDDGVEQNTYVTGLGTAFASNVNFTGQAEIVPGWTAGYVLHVELDGCDVYTSNQNTSCGPMSRAGQTSAAQTLYSYWFLKSDQLGKVSVGHLSPADDSAVMLIDGSGTLQAAYWIAYDVFGFSVRGNFAPNESLIWGNAASCRGNNGGPGDCNGLPLNVVRYDTPVFNGFSASASWGEDDDWALAGRYSGQIGDFKLNAVVTYSETSDSKLGAPAGGSLEYMQAGAYLQHVPTGLFALAGYGHLDQDVNPLNIPATDTYYFKGGVRLKLTSLGATAPYGEYLFNNEGAFVRDDNGTVATADDTSRFIDSSETRFWGFGVVQEIDAAALSVWLRYREHEVDLPGIETDDMKTVVFGSFISF